MNTDQRISKIEEFVHLQRYIHGVKFRVVEESTDRFTVELDGATERQVASLNHWLRTNMMHHIRARSLHPKG